MTIMKFTVNVAFCDIEDAKLDTIRSEIVSTLLDDFCAEVAYSSDAKVSTMAIADPDWDADDPDGVQINGWQIDARRHLEAL